jgi:hypothetical protein
MTAHEVASTRELMSLLLMALARRRTKGDRLVPDGTFEDDDAAAAAAAEKRNRCAADYISRTNDLHRRAVQLEDAVTRNRDRLASLADYGDIFDCEGRVARETERGALWWPAAFGGIIGLSVILLLRLHRDSSAT